jgi:biopolymer transport protein ExbB
MLELFSRGGPLMWPIVGCSMVAMAFFVERLLVLRRRHVLPPQVFTSLREHLQAGDFTRAIHLCREQGSALCRIILAGLQRRGSNREVIKQAMEETGGLAVGKLDHGVGVLSTVAAIAPLLGLLGTVTGMIKVFRDVAGIDNPDIAVLARGIWEALITTGAGLSVAIPTYVAFRYVESRIDRYTHELEEASLTLLDAIAETPVAADKPSPDPS